jgi:hypothetical protein
MATLDAIKQVGESVVKLLRDRRALLAAEGRLGPVPPTADIAHLSAARLATGTEPTAGLTLTLYRVAPSDHAAQPAPMREPSRPASLALDLYYLLACWSAAPAEEQALLGWAMLELARFPILDRSLLTGTSVWDRAETVQIVPETITTEALMRIWDGFQRKYRLSTTLRARVVRISYGPDASWPPVVATRLGFADTDPLEPEPT